MLLPVSGHFQPPPIADVPGCGRHAPTRGRKRFDCAHLLAREVVLGYARRWGVPTCLRRYGAAQRAASDIAEQLGCELMETPMGTQIRANEA